MTSEFLDSVLSTLSGELDPSLRWDDERIPGFSSFSNLIGELDPRLR
jgi:hypothetical protein